MPPTAAPRLTHVALFVADVPRTVEFYTRFAGLHAAANGSVVRALLVDPDGTHRLESVATPDRVAPSLMSIAPAAHPTILK